MTCNNAGLVPVSRQQQITMTPCAENADEVPGFFGRRLCRAVARSSIFFFLARLSDLRRGARGPGHPKGCFETEVATCNLLLRNLLSFHNINPQVEIPHSRIFYFHVYNLLELQLSRVGIPVEVGVETTVDIIPIATQPLFLFVEGICSKFHLLPISYL